MINQEIKKILTERKNNAEQLANNNLQYAFSLNGFKEKYDNLKFKQIQNAKAKVYGNAQIFDKEINSLEKEIEIFLAKHKDNKRKITFADLSPKYTCQKCKDNGYDSLGNECECVKAIKTHILNFKEKLNTFANCDYSIFENKKIPALFQRFEIWANKKNKEKTNLVVLGPSGTGKTFFCQCLASEFIKQGKYTLYKTAFAMNQDFLKYHTTFTEDKYKFIEPYINCDVLIIDDLGSEQIFKNTTVEYLYLVLNERVQNRKITIINSNLEQNDFFSKYGERCTSRILNKEISYVVVFEQSDLRRRSKKA